MKNKYLTGMVLAMLCLFASSVFAAKSKSKDTSNERVDQVLSKVNSVTGGRGDIWFEDIPSSATKSYSASNFYASDAFLTLDKFFKFSTLLTDEQLLKLGKALFKNIPVDEESSVLRVIVVNKYFEDDSNLVISINKEKLKKGSFPGKEYGYVFMVNVAPSKTQDKKTGEKTIEKTKDIINYKTNYNLLFIPYENGVLVRSRNVNLGTKVYSEELSIKNKIGLIDKFLFDESEANDKQIEKIYKEINESDADNWNKYGLNNLNYGLYLAKLEKYDEAEKFLNGIDSQKIPAEKKKQYEYIISRDIPFLLKIMKGL